MAESYHLKYSSSTGHLLRNASSGHLVNDCGYADYKLVPCYEISGTTCSRCNAGTTPDDITAIISGISAGQCIVGAGASSKRTSGSPNGSCLVRDMGACIWDNGTFGTFSWEHWHNETCTGEPVDSGESDFAVMVFRLGTPDRWYCTIVSWLEELFAGGTEVTAGSCALRGLVLNNDLGSGTVTLYAGDTEGGGRCPGGSAIYTDTDLSANVGKVVEIGGVCYAVYDNSDPYASDGAVTVTQSCDDCSDCCADTC